MPGAAVAARPLDNAPDNHRPAGTVRTASRPKSCAAYSRACPGDVRHVGRCTLPRSEQTGPGTPLDELGEFLADYLASFDGTVTLTARQNGWCIDPRRDDASPVSVLGDDPNLWDLTICFGRSAGRIELRCSKRVTPAEALATAKEVVRGAASGGLTEQRRGEHGSKRTIRSGDQQWRGSANWVPWFRRGVEEHFASWGGHAWRVREAGPERVSLMCRSWALDNDCPETRPSRSMPHRISSINQAPIGRPIFASRTRSVGDHVASYASDLPGRNSAPAARRVRYGPARHFNRGQETCIQVRGVRPFAHRSEIGVRVLGFLAFGEGKDSLNAVGMDD